VLVKNCVQYKKFLSFRTKNVKNY